MEQTGRAPGGVVTNAGGQAGVGQVHPVADAGPGTRRRRRDSREVTGCPQT